MSVAEASLCDTDRSVKSAVRAGHGDSSTAAAGWHVYVRLVTMVIRTEQSQYTRMAWRMHSGLTGPHRLGLVCGALASGVHKDRCWHRGMKLSAF